MTANISYKKRHRDPGEIVAWYWGFAYRDYNYDEIILYIIPMNWIVGITRRFWLWIRQGTRNDEYETIRAAAWKDGWEAAKKTERSIQNASN